MCLPLTGKIEAAVEIGHYIFTKQVATLVRDGEDFHALFKAIYLPRIKLPVGVLSGWTPFRPV